MKKITMEEILEKLQIGSIFGDSQSYYSREKGELVDVQGEYIEMIENLAVELEDEYDKEKILDKIDFASYDEWESDEIKLALDLYLNNDKYVEFISLSETENLDMMKEFASIIVEKKYEEELLKVIDEYNSYKKFKEAITTFKLDDKWNDFRNMALTQRAKFWCLKNGIDHLD